MSNSEKMSAYFYNLGDPTNHPASAIVPALELVHTVGADFIYTSDPEFKRTDPRFNYGHTDISRP